MERIQRVNHQSVFIPPDDSEDSLADDTDEDPDYTPEEGQKRKRSVISFEGKYFLSQFQFMWNSTQNHITLLFYSPSMKNTNNGL